MATNAVEPSQARVVCSRCGGTDHVPYAYRRTVSYGECMAGGHPLVKMLPAEDVLAALPKWLAFADRVLRKLEPGSGSRSEYANGKGTLSGCSLSTEYGDIDLMLDAMEATTGVRPAVVVDRVAKRPTLAD